ncbi:MULTISPECIES: lamin tail domain-containing protein [unclassified Carboxylicivirga]|uniref:lamin tail domain-containing protein n=1 Tax=Carboxylicivirga TaxID=1628153 RepID=UPI003D32E62D
MQRIFTLLILLPYSLMAQLNESFNDGDFTANPTWQGNTAHFVINSDLQLQLMNKEAGTSFLSTHSTISEEATWEFRIRMNFNPSSGNYARVYLISDIADLPNATRAIYVELGSSDDNICLYALENGRNTKIIEGLPGRLNQSNVEALVRISREGNNWQLQSYIADEWHEEGSASYPFLHSSNYFGIFCQYTTTRADKFYFDDLMVSGQPYKDQHAPSITHFEVLNGSNMLIKFDEALDANHVESDNFRISSNGRHPSAISYNSNEHNIQLYFSPLLADTQKDSLIIINISDEAGNTMPRAALPYSYERVRYRSHHLINSNTLQLGFTKHVPMENLRKATLLINNTAPLIDTIRELDEYHYHLILATPLQENSYHQLTVERCVDAVGDTLPPLDTQILYHAPQRFDVVLNEWMADPTPPMDLPEEEYIEIVNNTDYPIPLADWQMMINDRTCTLPDSILQAQSYLCLVDESRQDEWLIPQTVFVSDMPSLINAGFTMALLSPQNRVIDAFRYEPNTIGSEGFKKEGGWSVERTDATNHSGHPSNYGWCMDLRGGTPSLLNSTAVANPDTTIPQISNIQLLENQRLQIDFSECMLFENVNYTITPDPGVSHLTYDTLLLRSLKMHFNKPLTPNTVYFLSALNISDVSGKQLLLNDPLAFGRPDTLAPGDLFINEVLFNPYPDGADFVELYNASDKIIDMATVYLATIEAENITRLHAIAGQQHLLMPKHYVAISTDIETLCTFYHCEQAQVTEAASMPSYPDDEGRVVLCNKAGLIMDDFHYTDKMHFELIKDTEGVSLERLSWESPTHETNNWHSAASTAGFATPGYANSQQAGEEPSGKQTFSITPEVFTPDGDGNDDFLMLYYNTDETDATATVRIYNARGHEVRYLVNNQTLSATGYFRWDGLNNKGTQLSPGIYIVYCSLVYPSGETVREKLSCVIAVDAR